MSGDLVAHAFTTYMGAQILTDEFASFLIEEGLADESHFSELFAEEEETEVLTIDTVKEMMDSSYTFVLCYLFYSHISRVFRVFLQF